MKLYLVAPVIPANSDDEAVNARLRSCVDPIADLVLSHIATDPALFALRHTGEVTQPSLKPEMLFGYAEAARIADHATLRRLLTDSGDPFSGKSTLIRSLVTCCAVSYGYDGQAFVCLPTEARSIVSPDDNLITVEDCSEWLLKTDWMDGLLND